MVQANLSNDTISLPTMSDQINAEYPILVEDFYKRLHRIHSEIHKITEMHSTGLSFPAFPTIGKDLRIDNQTQYFQPNWHTKDVYSTKGCCC